MAQQPLNENPIQLKKLAKELDLPENYLSKVLQTLNKANIINSFRGAKRGYKLAKKPEDITFLEIIETFEGPVNGNLCLLDLDSCIFGECVLNGALNNLTDSVKSILSKTTIKEEFGV
jgi:Rrf2 family protein